MKKSLLYTLCFLLLQSSAAWALSVGITLPEDNNVRAEPTTKSDIIYVYKYPADSDELYAHSTNVVGQKGNWLEVYTREGTKGWMHNSLLGFCTSAPKAGPCPVRKSPSTTAATVATPRGGMLVKFKELGPEGWTKISYTQKGKTINGWMPTSCLVASAFCPKGQETTLTFRNESDFPLISAEIKNIIETRKPALGGIEKGQSVSIRKPANEVSDLDLYMGMSNAVHFIFKNVPVQDVDTVEITTTEDSTPWLELFYQGKSKGKIQGQMQAEDLS